MFGLCFSGCFCFLKSTVWAKRSVLLSKSTDFLTFEVASVLLKIISNLSSLILTNYKKTTVYKPPPLPLPLPLPWFVRLCLCRDSPSSAIKTRPISSLRVRSFRRKPRNRKTLKIVPAFDSVRFNSPGVESDRELTPELPIEPRSPRSRNPRFCRSLIRTVIEIPK